MSGTGEPHSGLRQQAKGSNTVVLTTPAPAGVGTMSGNVVLARGPANTVMNTQRTLSESDAGVAC
jgi:hypothetical protein